jgi:GT2 family glycosyltransferase/glycosyltransferase involved in cell wall biosynthesis
LSLSLASRWYQVELRCAAFPCGQPIQLSFNLNNGSTATHCLRLATQASGGFVVLPLEADPLAADCTPHTTTQLSWQAISPRLARLAMARQLCAEDPATLFTDAFELLHQLDALDPLQALDRLWHRYASWLADRPTPLQAPNWLEGRPLADGSFQPPPVEASIARIRGLWPLLLNNPQPQPQPQRRVSVVLPIYGEEAVTLRCLASLLQEQLRAPAPTAELEILCVDDASPTGSLDHLAALVAECNDNRLQLVRQPDNLGYLRSCNHGATLATGELLCFLNNDTVVTPGWLSELINTLEGVPDAGLVGPKLLYPDGRLQEAGGIVWRDGSAWNYGRNDDADDPAYGFCRDVDYVSGACLVMRTELFRRIGGFDNRYAPAYYEDTDLAMAVQDLGYRVLMQPLAKVIHYEGISSGRDNDTGPKRFQERNARLFRSKWQRQLQSHAVNGTAVWHERNRGRVGRILVMEASLPTPDRDAGSLYIYNLLNDLLALGWDVSYLPADNLLWQPDYAIPLQRLGVEVLVHPWVASVPELLEQRGDHYEAILVARPEIADRWLEAIKTHAPLARLLYYTHDLHHLRMERQRAIQPEAVSAAAIEHMRRCEQRILDVVDGVLYLSSDEQRQAMESLRPRAAGFVLPPRVRREAQPQAFHERQGVVFLGGFGHPPNTDAVLWYVHEVLPLLRQRVDGDAVPHLHVVGAKPPPEIQALAGDGVTVHGYVANLAPLLGRLRVGVAPLRFGAGVKGKMLTTMAAGLPLVATSVAAEGLGLRDGLTVRLADDPEAFASAVIALHTSAELWDRQVDAASGHLEAGWGASVVRERLAQALQGVGLPVAAVARPLPEEHWPLPLGAGPDGLLAFYNLHER